MLKAQVLRRKKPTATQPPDSNWPLRKNDRLLEFAAVARQAAEDRYPMRDRLLQTVNDFRRVSADARSKHEDADKIGRIQKCAEFFSGLLLTEFRILRSI